MAFTDIETTDTPNEGRIKLNANFADAQTQLDAKGSGPFVNVLDHGAVGDDSTDDTAAIQAAEDAAFASGGVLYFPGKRTYRITDTIDRHQGVNWIGGGTNGSNEAEAVQIRWNGAAGGVMCSIDAGLATNIMGAYTENIVFRGTSGSNMADTAIRFWSSEGTAAKPDTWTGFDRCGFFDFSDDAIRFESLGITNAFIHRCRGDAIGGYFIYVNLNAGDGENATCFLEIQHDITWDNGPSGQTMGDGFLFLDAESAHANGTIFASVRVADFHPEVNASLNQTYSATGVTENGKRGIIRLGVGGGGSGFLYDLRFDHIWLTGAPTTAAHSFVQFTSAGATFDGTVQNLHSKAASMIITSLSGLSTLDPIGGNGTVTLVENVRSDSRYPFETDSGDMRPKQVGFLAWAPYFPDADAEGRMNVNMMRSWFSRVRFSDAPQWMTSKTTVGAAGGASALPATPTKYLAVKDEAGTTLLIPAYTNS